MTGRVADPTYIALRSIKLTFCLTCRVTSGILMVIAGFPPVVRGLCSPVHAPVFGSEGGGGPLSRPNRVRRDPDAFISRPPLRILADAVRGCPLRTVVP